MPVQAALTHDALRRYPPLIDKKVVEIIDEFRSNLPEYAATESEWMLDTISEYCLRPGKRIRGSLASATYDFLIGETHAEHGVILGASVELMHNYLLIIDDVMDQSPIRRGELTVHQLYMAQYPEATSAQADMVAINIGLLLQHIASLAMASIDAKEYARSLERVMHHNIALTGLGQMDDLHQTLARQVSSQQIMDKYKKKSGYYTFVNPIESAYALAGKLTPQVTKDCEAFGLPAGVAFQMRDDYIGIFGDEKKSGKTNLDDVHEGKYTMLVAETLPRISTEVAGVVSEMLGNHQVTEVELERLRSIMHGSGAVQRVQDKMEGLIIEATKAAESAESWDEEYGRFLTELLEYSVRRDA